MDKRYTLSVPQDVYVALMDQRLAALHKTGKAPTLGELLRKALKLSTKPPRTR